MSFTAPRTVLRYLWARRRLTRDYASTGLDGLLSRSEGRNLEAGPPLPRLLRSIRIAEALAPRLGLRPNTCLFRALTRFELLRRAGHDATFCMGVHPDDTDVGHAWVELGGCGVLERIPHELVTTYRYP